MSEDLKNKLDNLGNDKLSPLNAKKLETYNSLNPKTNKQPAEIKKPDVQAVVVKKSGFQKFSEETNFKENAKNAGQFILRDVILPALKKTIDDIVCGGIKTMLYGENANIRNMSNNNGHIPYSSISTGQNGRATYVSNSTRRAMNDNVAFLSKTDAIDALEYLSDVVREDGQCTVAQLYELGHTTPDYTDHYYGWKDLRGVDVVPYLDKWILSLPKPILLRR